MGKVKVSFKKNGNAFQTVARKNKIQILDLFLFFNIIINNNGVIIENMKLS